MSLLEVNNLSYVYSRGTPYEKTALKDINFSINDGEILGVVGHSGCGKSTLSKLINGLLKPASGSIILNNVDIWSNSKNIKYIRYEIGLVFQYPEHQLFAETVKKDIEFGVVNMGLDREEIDNRVKEVCNIVNIPISMLNKSPFSLSGGEQRRVALAGILCMKPKILVLDEPTSSLDSINKNNLLKQIVDYRDKYKASIIFISHNMQEISSICDKILIIKNGNQIALDTPKNIFFDDELLSNSGINAPQITEIAKRLIKLGYPIRNDILTVNDMLNNLFEILNGGDI